jgi:predicted permease
MIRAFRLLLALYPGEFRDEYGRELALVFADRYRDAATARERMRVWFEAVTGVLREAPKEQAQVLAQDLRYALRLMIRSPGFAATAILTLALGIGANTAIFQLIDAVGWRPLPIPHPEQLVAVRIVGGNRGFGLNPGRYGGITRPAWEQLRRSQDAFAGLFAWSGREMRVGEIADLRRVNGIAVSGEFFSVLGVTPGQGRLIEPADEASACPSSHAVVSYDYWRRTFGDRGLTRDARLRINGQMHEIVGITHPWFFGLAVGESYDVAVPLCRQPAVRAEVFDINVMGRLRPGWTIERASAYVNALSGGIFDVTAPSGYAAAATAIYKSFRLAVYPAASGVSALRDQYSDALRLLLGLTGLVLLIACANLANLMLARAISREREIAVRLAIGASRARLLRQLMSETLLLATLGAVLAAGLAQVLSRLLVWSLATDEGRPTLAIAAGWHTVLFTAVLSIATCVIFGTAPAIRALRMRADVSTPIRGRGMTMSRGRFTAQRLIVVMQIATSLVLLFAAVLFLRSFRNLVTFDPGMRQQGISVAFIGFDALNVSPDHFNDFQRQLLTEIKRIPGVINAATTTNAPLLGNSWTHVIRIDNHENSSRFTWVSPEYFATMNIPVLQGRDFTFRDTAGSTRVAIVNQAFVREFFGNANPLGRTLRTLAEPHYPETAYEIVGVIADTRYDSYRSGTQPMAFAPDSQFPEKGPWTAMMIYGRGDPAATGVTIRRVLSRRYPQIVSEFVPFQARIRSGLLRERLLAMLAGFFGALAAILVVVGLYGMMSFAVAERRHEIGIRIALGAERRRVIAMIMRQAGVVLAIGLAAGAAVALAAAPAAATLLFGLEPSDPATLASACFALIAIAAMASYIPARRAARLNPLIALRQE